MKQILITLLLTAYCTGFISHESYSQVFIRIYNDHGKKISKGTIEYTTESAIVIVTKNKMLEQLSVREISFIKTKRSFGAGIVAGSAMGMLISAGAVTKSDADWNEKGIGVLVGTAAGALAGTIVGIATKKEKFIIKGSIEKWKLVRQQLATMSKKDILVGPAGTNY